MSAARERELKRAVVRAARGMLDASLVVGSLGNVSARDPEQPNVIYITPSGLLYTQLLPEDVVRIDLEGRRLAGGHAPSSEWRLHTAIYRAQSEINAVVHAHGTYAQAWSFLGEPLPARTEELEIFAGGDVRVAQYAPSGSQDLADRAVEALRDRRAALLARHGIVAVGTTLDEALVLCQIVERQAQVAWLLRVDPASR
jgi:L-fuculose-phosphate aldolase